MFLLSGQGCICLKRLYIHESIYPAVTDALVTVARSAKVGNGLDPETVQFAVQQAVVVIPGTLTPTDVIAAWKLSPDFIKVVPCGQVGGHTYIQALKAMFPGIPLVAAGGVTQQTAANYILAGAVALGIGAELIPREAIRRRQPDRISELARRFTAFVSGARSQQGQR